MKFSTKKMALSNCILTILVVLHLSSLVLAGECTNLVRKDQNRNMITCSTLSLDEMNNKLKFLVELYSSLVDVHLEIDDIDFSEKVYIQPTLHKDWLEANLTIFELIMDNVNLLKIGDNAFNTAHFAPLQIITILNAPISLLSKGAFNGLENLRKISFKQVELKTFEAKILASTPNLEQFKMENCGGHGINVENLFGMVPMRYLRYVEIINCNLSDTITKKTFSGLDNIIELRLSSNKITKIGPKSFDVPLRNLKKLQLNENKLKMLPDGIFDGTMSKININLDDNEWHCDCELDYLQKVIQLKSDTVMIDSIICSSPSRFLDYQLDACPDLCEKDIEDELEKKSLVSILRNEAIIESENELESEFDNEYDSSAEDRGEQYYEDEDYRFDNKQIVKCEESTANAALSINLNYDGILSIRIDQENLYLISENLPIMRTLIGIEQEAKSDGIIKCLGSFESVDENVEIEFKLKPNKIYRFCRMQKNSDYTKLSECILYYSKMKSDVIDVKSTWLLTDSKPIIISIGVIFAIFILFMGILFAMILALIFPKRIRPRRTIIEKTPKTIEEQMAINRLKQNDRPLRRIHSTSKYTRPINQMSTHAAIFENFNEQDETEEEVEESIYLTISDIPPPVPPRDIITDRM